MEGAKALISILLYLHWLSSQSTKPVINDIYEIEERLFIVNQISTIIFMSILFLNISLGRVIKACLDSKDYCMGNML